MISNTRTHSLVRSNTNVPQVDGPSHFAANVPNRPLGPTVARDRCLTQLEGLALVVVPWFEWGALRVRP